MAVLLSFSSLHSQTDECATKCTVADYQTAISQLSTIRSAAENVPAQSVATVPVRIYIVLTDDGLPATGANIDETQVNDYLAHMSAEFSTHSDFDFDFVLCGDINFIHNSSFQDGSINIRDYTQTPQAVDVFVLDSPGNPSAAFPWQIGSNNSILLKDYNSFLTAVPTLTHEMGHHFGLLHTFSPEVPYNSPPSTTQSDYPYGFAPRELVIREPDLTGTLTYSEPNHGGPPYDNPALYSIGGDFIGQTPPGCRNGHPFFPGCSFTGCNYDGTYVDYNGMPIDDPTNILAKNFMSYGSCREEFVDEQLERAFGYYFDFRRLQYDPDACGNLSGRVEFEDTNNGQDRVAITFDQFGIITKTLTSGDGDFDGIVDQSSSGIINSAFTSVAKLGSNSDFTFTYADWVDGVTTWDAFLIRKHILMIELLPNGYKQVAADVNNSGNISTFDALLVQKLVLGINTTFSAFDQPWRFIPEFFTENSTYSEHFDGGGDDAPFTIGIFDAVMAGTQSHQIAPARQGFDAVKLGDVNGSNSEAFTGQNPPNEGDPVYIDIVKTVENGQAFFDFKVEDFEDIVAYQFDIEFEKQYINFTESLLRDLEGVNSAFFGTSLLDEGIIPTIWLDEVDADASSLDDLEEIFRLVFEGDVTNAGAMVNITNEVGFRSTDIPVQKLKNIAYTSDGTIRPIVQREYKEGNIAAFSIVPNPFSGTFQLNVEALSKGGAELRVFNSVGQLVHTSSTMLEKGANQITVNHLSHLSEGIYFVQVETDGVTVSKKVMKN